MTARLAAMLITDRGDRFIVVPMEGPVEHLRNAVFILDCLREQSPAVAAFTPELAKTIRRAETAVLFLEARGVFVPLPVRMLAVELTIEAAMEIKLDWDVVPEMKAAMWRLFRAWDQARMGAMS